MHAKDLPGVGVDNELEGAGGVAVGQRSGDVQRAQDTAVAAVPALERLLLGEPGAGGWGVVKVTPGRPR